MEDKYYTLENFCDVVDPSEFGIERTRSLLSAVQRQRDYSVIRLLKRDDSKFECIVVDVQTDGVPPKNSHEIRYKERLALCIPDNQKQLIEVLALRESFPTLMHQNQSRRNGPRSLCLYFEPPASVMRTWTPDKFLRRIQWWLEKSATGELHPADQPVEQLFFASKYELILPWNYEDVRNSRDHRLVIRRGPDRPNEGVTCFLEALPKDSQLQGGTVQHIEFTLPSIEQGPIEHDPTTLGELSDMMLRRDVDILPSLQNGLCVGIGPAGVPEFPDNAVTLILIHVPITRTKGMRPESTIHRAFMIPIGARRLGVATGAIVLVEVPEGQRSVKKFFRRFEIGPKQTLEWRDESIYSVEVLFRNDSALARKQSGLGDKGPAGVVIGAGSLGSALLNLWGRSGWGQWTVIDKDHIKPHNLSRHVAYSQHIGYPKSNVVADLHTAAMEDASQVIPINVDACDFAQPSLISALHTAKLVVDASTTLEYPRAVSDVEGVGRHISVFITPNGNAAVLLAESTDRKVRLRCLEAQYYRAVIREDWGQHHLDGNLGSFWSGASCRDITMVIPYSRILSLAGTLAEQIPLAAASPDSQIHVWHRDPQLGSVNFHDISVSEENCLSLKRLRLFIDSGLIEQLRELRTANLPSETGGVLLGYYDFNVSAVTVVAALPAPTDSNASPGSFERGVEGLAEAVRDASRRTADIVGYIGEWHSHPPHHSASPSKADLAQLFDLARRMSEDGLPAVQLIVGEQDVRILQSTVEQ